MQKTSPTLVRLQPDEIWFGADYLDFLKHLEGPVQIDVAGIDRSRCRAIVTLLHANEPSGLKAVYQLLKNHVVPATDLIIIIASVNAALHPPLLSHRFLPWEADLNRCFTPACTTNQGELARAIVAALEARTPEAVLDTHNTSAHSEPFAVTTVDQPSIRQLTRYFANHLVVMDQSLGTLIDCGKGDHPWLTVEFGGLMDPRADILAVESLTSFITTRELFTPPGQQPDESEPLNFLYHPMRLEISGKARLHYSSSVVNDSHITMFNTIDQLNFQRIQAGTALGWLSPDGLSRFNLRCSDGIRNIDDYFCNNNGFLTTARPLTLFMATTDPYIARKDCLLYLTT